MPAPAAIDWDANGTADEQDEWIELYNGGTTAVDLGGWSLDAAAGSSAYRIPEGTTLQPGAFVVFFRQATGIALADDGAQVRLLGPDSTVVDDVTLDVLPPDASYSRDESGTWHSDWPPSPGAPNSPPLTLLPWQPGHAEAWRVGLRRTRTLQADAQRRG